MDDSRLNKLIHDWMCNKRSHRCKNWSFRPLKQLEKYNIQENSDNSVVELSNAYIKLNGIRQSILNEEQVPLV